MNKQYLLSGCMAVALLACNDLASALGISGTGTMDGKAFVCKQALRFTPESEEKPVEVHVTNQLAYSIYPSLYSPSGSCIMGAYRCLHSSSDKAVEPNQVGCMPLLRYKDSDDKGLNLTFWEKPGVNKYKCDIEEYYGKAYKDSQKKNGNENGHDFQNIHIFLNDAWLKAHCKPD